MRWIEFYLNTIDAIKTFQSLIGVLIGSTISLVVTLSVSWWKNEQDTHRDSRKSELENLAKLQEAAQKNFEFAWDIRGSAGKPEFDPLLSSWVKSVVWTAALQGRTRSEEVNKSAGILIEQLQAIVAASATLHKVTGQFDLESKLAADRGAKLELLQARIAHCTLNIDSYTKMREQLEKEIVSNPNLLSTYEPVMEGEFERLHAEQKTILAELSEIAAVETSAIEATQLRSIEIEKIRADLDNSLESLQEVTTNFHHEVGVYIRVLNKRESLFW